MLIKTRLYLVSATLVALTLVVTVIAISSFNAITDHFHQVSKSAKLSADSAQSASSQANQSASQTESINQRILETADSIQKTNQKAKLTSKKVKELSESLNELVELIEELSEDVADEEALSILEEVADELIDIEERARREALINLVASTQSIGQFSQDMVKEADEISQLNTSIASLTKLAEAASDASEQITKESQYSLAEIAKQRSLILTLLVLLAIVAIASGLILMRVVTRPIHATVHLMEDIAQGEGDLTQRLQVDGKNEMSAIANGFNLFVEKVQNLLLGFTSTTDSLRQTANQTFKEMDSSHQALQQQLQEIEQIATAVEQMNATSLSVANNAVDAAAATSQARTQLDVGKQSVSSAQSAVSELVHQVEQASETITLLDERSQEITRVVDVITAVAEQTNLLALNAAIEAARAGEQGRGFAVVADEVRNLAGKAESSANDIRAIVDELQAMTGQAVNAMTASQSASRKTADGTQEVIHVLEDITQAIQTIDAMNTQIASAEEQETCVTQELNQRISSVNQFSHETSKGVEQTVEACHRLNQIADQIHRQLSQFRV